MGYIQGRVQFQKLVFLLEKNYNLDVGYEFVPYKFGPFCETLQSEINQLIEYGYIEHEEMERIKGEKNHRFQITEHGEQYLLETNVPAIYDELIEDLCYDFRNYNLKQLISYVYERYPEFITKSEIKSDYYHPVPELKDFTTVDRLVRDRKIVIKPNYVEWLEDELDQTKSRLGLTNLRKTDNSTGGLKVDELVISIMEIAYDDIITKAQEIATQISIEEHSESGGINNKIYYIVEILKELLVSIEDQDIIGICTEITNTQTNIQMLQELITLNRTSLKSEIVRSLFDFIEDIEYFLDSINQIVAL